MGINAGDGVRAVNVTGTNTNDVINIENTTNIGEPGIWVFQVNGPGSLGNVFTAHYTWYMKIQNQMYGSLGDNLITRNSIILPIVAYQENHTSSVS